MKKHLLIAGLAVLSTGAYATTARLQALGQDTARGSFFIDDNYNVFRNAAYVNTYKNYIVTEWGDESGTTGGNEQLEGGFFREMGAFAYGVYFNNESDTGEAIAQKAANPISGVTFVNHKFATSNNALDLFFGGDMGVQWGARFQYTKSSDKQDKTDLTAVTDAYNAEHEAMNLSLGIMMGDLGAYANIGLKNDYTGSQDNATNNGDASSNGDKLEGAGSMNFGVNYKLGAMKAFADYSTGGQEYTDASDTTFKKEWEGTTINVGVGHTHEVSSTARVFSQISYYSKTTEVTNATASGDNLEQKITKLPITVGFEADANSWLTLRGSITQALPFLNKTEFTDSDTADSNDEDENPATTAFAAGATLNFGKLKLDGVITNGGETFGGSTGSSDFLRTDLLMSKVAVHYHF